MKALSGLILLAVWFVATSAAQTAAPVELPMRLVNGMPAVEVFVNGQGPFVFRIDTGGAGQARVDAALAQKMALPQVGEARGGDGSGSAVTMQIVKVETLKLGPLEFKNIEAPSRDYNRGGDGERIDGILCFGLFADHLFTLDYLARKVKLSQGALPAPDGQRVFPFSVPRGIPVISFDLAGTPAEADIDSGNMSAGFMLGQEHAGKLKFAQTPVVVGRGRTISSEFDIKEGELTGEVRLGAYRFPAPSVRFTDALPRCNIGARVLREFAVTFDQKNRRVRWERADEIVKLTSAPPRAVTAAAATPFSATEAAAYIGSYGQRTITFADGQLYLQRTGGPKLKLIKLGTDEFGLAEVPEARIRFAKDAAGKATEMRVRNLQGEWEAAPRQ